MTFLPLESKRYNSIKFSIHFYSQCKWRVMVMNAKKIGIGILVAILIAVSFYFFYWTKTPQYSITLIQQAVKNHNVDKFERYVDLESIYNKAYDDVIAKSVTPKNNTDKVANALFAGFMQMFKPTVVSALKEATLKEISGAQKLETSAQQQKGDVKDGITKVSEANRNSELKDISVIYKESEVAMVGITLHDKELSKDFVLKVKMNKLDNGEWRVKEINNLVEYMEATKKAKIEKILERDKIAKAEMDKYIKVQLKESSRFGTGGSSGKISKIAISISAELTNLVNQDLQDIKVVAKIYNRDNKVIKTTDFSKVTSIKAKSKRTITTYIGLNYNDSVDRNLMNDDLSKYIIKLYVISCKTPDGKVIERPKEIINENI